MRTWYEVARPRADILRGDLDDALFAADLADVVKGRGPLEYRDPARFFEQTHPTAGLLKLLASAAQRLAHGGGDSVIQLQTPFGGGKTHALISLYHLFTSGERHRQHSLVARTLEQAGLSALPQVRVACFIGTEADPLQGRTPWGEIAHQLGMYDRVEEHDRRRRAPGGEQLYAIVAEQPTLILLDELVAYAVSAKDFADQIMVFCQTLTETVRSARHSLIVATLPSSAPYGEEGERQLRQLEQIFGRVQAIYTPVEGDEFFEVIRQRLFEEITDPTEARNTVDAFYELYQRHSDSLPDEVRPDAYRERMRRAYPFHPEIIDVLYNRWSTFTTFQRTRGVLRFLANMLYDLYTRREPTPLILPMHLNLRNAALRSELIRHIGNQYEGVVHQDILTNAEQLDKQLGSEFAPYRVASGLASVIFFESFDASGASKGITEPRLRLAALQPNLPPSVIGDALHKIATHLWYLHSENGRYRFGLQPNLNRVVLDAEERVSPQDAEQELRKQVARKVGNALGETRLFPEQSSDLPDQKRLCLAILAPRHTNASSETRDLVQELLERYGGQPRVHRNCVVVLVADAGEMDTLQRRVKQLLALRAVRDDASLYPELSAEDKAQLESRLENAERAVEDLVFGVYRHLCLWRGQGVEWRNLGIPTAGDRRSLSERVRRYLENEDLLLKTLSPRMMLEKAVGNTEEKPVREIVDAFYRYAHLPMIESDEVALDAIARGVREGLFGVRIGEQVYYQQEPPRSALEYDAVLVRYPEVQQPSPATTQPSTVQETKGTVTTATNGGVTIAPPPPPPKPNQPSYQRYALRAVVPSEKMSEFATGVVAQIMQRTGLNFRFTIEFEVKGELPRELVDISIRETLRQINAEIQHEQKE